MRGITFLLLHQVDLSCLIIHPRHSPADGCIDICVVTYQISIPVYNEIITRNILIKMNYCQVPWI